MAVIQSQSMSIRHHKAIIATITMVRQGLPGKGKGKSARAAFQLQQERMKEQIENVVLRDYDGRLWALCYPEKEDATPPQTTIALTFWDDKNGQDLSRSTSLTPDDNKQKDSVIEVTTFRYSMYFENA